MTKQLANITVKVNQAAIKKEKRNGRDVWVVPSKTMPAGIVMNGLMYSGDEIERSYTTLSRTPAPFGHPKVDGMYVSASTPEAINVSWIGAYNEDVSWDGQRMSVNKVVDIEVAGRSEDGRRVLQALQKGEPISTSTGIFLESEEIDEPQVNAMGQEYSRIAKNLVMDHDAILLDEAPAAGPEMGTGVFVNSSNGEQERLDVLNANLDMEDPLDRAVTGMAWELVEAQEHERKRGLVESIAERLKTAVKSVLSSEPESEATGPTVNSNEDSEMPVTEEQFKALETKVDKLVTNSAKSDEKPVAEQVTEAVNTALKPIQDQLEANSKAERDQAIKTVVDNEFLDQKTAETLDTNALKIMAEKVGKPGVAAGVNSAFGKQKPEEYALPKGDE